MPDTPRFRGIYCPNIVPLNANDEIDEVEFRHYIDWLIDHGIHGIYPNGSTGEFTRFTPDERRRINEIAIDQTAGRVPVLAGAAEANTRETLAACEYYAELGADAVAIIAPFYYKVSASGVFAYFDEIGRHTPIDVTLYNIPMFASPIDLDTVRRLADAHPRIVAIKDSSGDLSFMKEMIESIRPQRPDFSFLTGWDTELLPMLQLGCDGGTNATSGIAPELTRKLFDLNAAGRTEEAGKVQPTITALFQALFDAADFPEGFRMGVDLRGIAAGTGRTPRSPADRARDDGTRKRLTALLAEAGVVSG